MESEDGEAKSVLSGALSVELMTETGMEAQEIASEDVKVDELEENQVMSPRAQTILGNEGEVGDSSGGSELCATARNVLYSATSQDEW